MQTTIVLRNFSVLRVFMLFSFCLMVSVPGIFGATIKVTSNADNGAGTLRDAINTSNLSLGVHDIIDFSLLAAGSQSITLASDLPIITDPVTIDGTLSQGYSAGNPQIEINGNNVASKGFELFVAASGSSFKALIINRCTFAGIHLVGSSSNTITGCFLGTDKAGLSPMPNGHGIAIQDASNNNTIGGLILDERNIISGNTNNGIDCQNLSNNNTIIGNYMGVGKDGATGVANNAFSKGISLNNCNSNAIGGILAGSTNIICNNGAIGIDIFAGATKNTVTGNSIGLDLNGNPNGNKNFGIHIDNSPANTIIANIISSQTNTGIILINGASGNTIQSNSIGLGKNGTGARGNGGNGIHLLTNCTGNIIGGTILQGNYICNNTFEGIKIEDGSNSNIVSGNFIGMDVSNNSEFNNLNGVYLIKNCVKNTIGGINSNLKNVISGNHGHGIKVETGCNNTTIQGNYIGVDSSGKQGFGNIFNGVNVIGSSGTKIMNCVIGGNKSSGIRFEAASRSNTVTGNYIGLGRDGTTAIGNLGLGLEFVTNCSNNTIGGTAAGLRNVICNNNTGISLTTACDTTSIINNFVGQNIKGALAGNGAGAISVTASNKTTIQGCAVVGSTTHGIHFTQNCTRNIVGGNLVSQRNVICNNGAYGVFFDVKCDTNTVSGNYIGVDSTGMKRATNGAGGVIMNNCTHNTIKICVVSGNDGFGIDLSGASANSIITGNTIGLNANKTAVIPNKTNGIQNTAVTNIVIGGLNPGDGNFISGNGYPFGNPLTNGLQGSAVSATGCDNLQVLKNVIGFLNDTVTAAGNSDYGIWINNSTNLAFSYNYIGNNGQGTLTLPGAKLGSGIRVGATAAVVTKTFIKGNVIGIDVKGNPKGNFNFGIFLEGPTSNVSIGGTSAADRNYISGNLKSGIYMANASNDTIYGNAIGIDKTGAAKGNKGNGITLANGSKGNIIGGVLPGMQNIIANSDSNGIKILDAASINNSIHRDSIYCNTLRGIELSGLGNNTYAAPVIDFTNSTASLYKGTAPANSFVEIFSIGAAPCITCSANSKKTQGRVYLGTVTASGTGTWSYIPSVSAAPDLIVATASSTASDAGNTSEFSACPAACVPPVINTNLTASVAACGSTNDVAKLFVKASGATSYTWMVDKNTGTFVNIVNDATYTIKVDSLIIKSAIGLKGYKYQVEVVGSIPSCKTTSATTTLTVDTLTAYGKITGTSPICSGTTTDLTLSTQSGQYQWQQSANPAGPFTNVTGGANPTASKYTTASLGAATYFQVALKNGSCNAATASFLVDVKPGAAITKQPTAATICEGTDSSFSVTASGASGLQWQIDKTNSGIFTNIPVGDPVFKGSTTSKLSFTGAVSSQSGYKFQVVVTGAAAGCQNPTSTPVTLKVDVKPTLGTLTGPATPVCQNQTTVLSLSANTGSLQFMQSPDGTNFVNAVGGSSSTVNPYTTAPITSMLVYKAVTTNGTCPQATSNTVTVNVTSAPTITTQPSPQNICANSKAIFSVALTGASGGYKWKVDKGAGLVDVTTEGVASGAQSETLTIATTPASFNGYKFVYTATGANPGCPATSNPAALTVETPAAGSINAPSPAYCVNQTATLTLAPAQQNIKWYQSSTGAVGSFNPIAGATSSPYVTAPLTDVTYYQATFTNGVCPVTTSAAVKIVVNKAPAGLASNTAGACTLTGDSLVLKNPVGSIQWQVFDVSKTPNWTSVPGATTAIYYLASVTAPGLYQAIVSAPGCPDFTSVPVAVKPCDIAVRIPNAFSPGTDGINDSFVIQGIVPNSSLDIYNRWGELLKSFSNYQNNWDGKDATDGVYYYIYKPGNGKQDYQGWVSVFKEK